MNTIILITILMNSSANLDISQSLNGRHWSDVQGSTLKTFEQACIVLSKVPTMRLRRAIEQYLKEDIVLLWKKQGRTSSEIEQKLGITKQIRAADVAILTRLKFYDLFGKVDPKTFGACLFAIEPNPWERTKSEYHLSSLGGIVDYYGSVFDALGEFDAYCALSNKRSDHASENYTK